MSFNKGDVVTVSRLPRQWLPLEEWPARIAAARANLAACTLCPHHCRVNRLAGQAGPCRVLDQPMISHAFPHNAEEPYLAGPYGCGTLFTTWCNMGCRFCQNFPINLQGQGEVTTVEGIASLMLQLQARGCASIAWVTPTHQLPFLLEALYLARQQGLKLPIVYNCGGYESVEALQWLEGIVDIYLPDFKYWDEAEGRRITGCPGYPEACRHAILEMFRQVGHLRTNSVGLARKGVAIRHLVMPGRLADTEAILTWIAETLGPDTAMSLMAQYRPVHLAMQTPGLDRPLDVSEYEAAMRIAKRLGLRNVLTQEHLIGASLPTEPVPLRA